MKHMSSHCTSLQEGLSRHDSLFYYNTPTFWCSQNEEPSSIPDCPERRRDLSSCVSKQLCQQDLQAAYFRAYPNGTTCSYTIVSAEEGRAGAMYTMALPCQSMSVHSTTHFSQAVVQRMQHKLGVAKYPEHVTLSQHTAPAAYQSECCFV